MRPSQRAKTLTKKKTFVTQYNDEKTQTNLD